MANESKKIPSVVPEERNTAMPIVTHRGLYGLLAGSDPDRPSYYLKDGRLVRNEANMAAQEGKRGTAVFDKSLGITTAEYLASEEKAKELADDIVNNYAVLSSRIKAPHNRNSIAERILNESMAIPDYAAQAVVGIGAGVYNAFAAQDRDMAEAFWAEYISQYDINDKDVDDLLYALNNAPEYFNPLNGSSKVLKGKDGKPLSDKSIEIFDRYRQLLQKRQEDAVRIKTMELFESEDVNGFRNFVKNSGQALGFEDLSHIGEYYEGDNATTIHTLAKLSGEVAGSVAVSYGVGGLYRGAAGALKVLKGIKNIKKAASVKAALQLSNQLFSNAAAVGAEFTLGAPIGLSQYEAIRRESLLAGKDINTANAIGFMAGAAEWGLESGGFKVFKRLYRRDGWIMNRILRDVLPEALQEGSQTAAEEIITNAFGVRSHTFQEAVYEVGLAMLGGALGGGIFANTRTYGENLLATYSYYEKQLNKFSEEIKSKAMNEFVNDKVKESAQETKTASAEQFGEENIALDLKEVEDAVKSDRDTNKVEIPQPSEDVNQQTEAQAVTQEQPAEAVVEQEQSAPQQEAQQEEQPKLPASLDKDVKDCKNIINLLYGDVFKIYKDIVSKKNPNITEDQLKNGFRAVAIQASLMKQGKLTELFNNVMNNSISYLNKQDEFTKSNIKSLDNFLQQKGYSEEVRKELLSKDWSVRHSAQWKLANQMVKDIFAKNGLSEAEADLSFKVMKGFAHDFTYLSPTTTVSDILNALDFNLINVQLEEFRGKLEIPENLRSILSNAVRNKNISDVNRIVDLFYQDTIEARDERSTSRDEDIVNRKLARSQDINDLLYGSDVDTTLQRTTASLKFLQGVFEKVYNESSFSADRDLTQGDFFKMAVMHTLGFSKAEIFDEFGITTQVEEDAANVDAAFDKYFNQVYPLNDSSKKSIKKMQNLLNKASGATNADEATGIFMPESNLAVVKNQAYNTAFHETSHFSATNFVTRIENLVQNGLVDENSPSLIPLKNLKQYFINSMSKRGKVVDERTLQETMIDAMVRFYNDPSIQQDKELRNILQNIENLSNYTYTNGIYNSIYDTMEDDTTKSGKEKLEGLTSTIKNILSENSPSFVLEKVDALQKMLTFETPVIPDTTKPGNQAKKYIDNVYGAIEEILNSTFVPNGDMFASALQNAKNSNDIFAMLSIGNDVAVSAKNFCFECLTKSSKSNKELGKKADALYNIQITPSGALLIKQPRTNILADAKSNIGDFKNMSGQELWNKSVEFAGKSAKSLSKTFRDFTESLSHAAYSVNNELGALIETTMFDYGMDTVADKELVAKFDKLTYDAFIKNPKLYTAFRVIISNPEIFVDKNGNSLVKQKAVDLLTKNISAEAGKVCADVFDRIDDVRRALQVYGLSSDMFKKGGYFPLRVKDYKGLLDHFGASQQAQSIKEAKRLLKELTDKAKKANNGREPTKEQLEKIYTQIYDFVNGSLRSSSGNDDYGVTAFFRRQLESRSPDVLQYYEDPMDSLTSFFESARRTVMMRKLAGYTKVDTVTDFETGEKVKLSPETGLAGRMVYNIGSFYQDENTQEAIQNFKEKFSYFTSRVKTDPDSFFGLLRQLNNITTLGSPVSMVNQAMDLVPMLEMYGYSNVVQGMKDLLKDRNPIKLKDVGVESSYEIYRPVGEGFLSKVQKFVFKANMFESFDTFIKESGLNSAKYYFADALKEEGTDKYNEAVKYIDEVFPETDFLNNSVELSQEKISIKQSVIEDLKDGTMSYNARAVLQHMLAKTQPINSVVAAAKLGAIGDFGKLCYQFTGPVLRQLEWLRDRILDKYKTGGAMQVGKDLAKLFLFLLAIGLPKEILTNLIRNRETNIPTTIALLPGHFFLINEYTLAVAKRDGVWAGLSTMVAPSGSWVNNVSKDFVRLVSGKEYRGYTLKSVPLFGDFAFYWMFGGYQFNKRTGISLVTNPLDEVQEEYNNSVDNLRRLGSK